jgi:hypothetical protein
LEGQLQCPITKLNARGIPPHLAIAASMDKITIQVKETNESLHQKLPETLTKTLLNHFQINGAIPITPQDMENHFIKLSKLLEEKIATKMMENTRQNNNNNENNQFEESKYNSFSWKGKIHPVPEDWKLPQVDMKTFWLMWHYGNPVEKITPLRMFHKFDFGIEKEGNKFMKMIKIIKLLTNIAEEKKLIENQQQIKQLPRDKVSEIFDVSFTHLMEKIHGRKINSSDRFGEMAVGTIRNHIDQWQKKQKQLTQSVAIQLQPTMAVILSQNVIQFQSESIDMQIDHGNSNVNINNV